MVVHVWRVFHLVPRLPTRVGEFNTSPYPSFNLKTAVWKSANGNMVCTIHGACQPVCFHRLSDI